MIEPQLAAVEEFSSGNPRLVQYLARDDAVWLRLAVKAPCENSRTRRAKATPFARVIYRMSQ